MVSLGSLRRITSRAAGRSCTATTVGVRTEPSQRCHRGTPAAAVNRGDGSARRAPRRMGFGPTLPRGAASPAACRRARRRTPATAHPAPRRPDGWRGRSGAGSAEGRRLIVRRGRVRRVRTRRRRRRLGRGREGRAW
jgi:hypothetical protein